jgi:CHAT domain-containing protein
VAGIEMSRSAIAGLMPAATVRIDIGHTPSGTGFFVAPGQILTCAHVIEPARLGSSIGVVDFRDREYEVREDPVTDQETDLAWLRLPTAPVDVPIALLLGAVDILDTLLTYGYPPGKPRGVPATYEVEGFVGGPQPFIKFKQGQVQPGMSGAPLLNLRTGAVCGVMRRTRDEQQALGGYGIPVEMIHRTAFFPDLQRRVYAANGARSAWDEALTPEQRRLVRPPAVTDEPSSSAEFVININQTDDGWVVEAAVYPGDRLGPVTVDLNTVRAEVARLFRAWRSQRRIDDSEQARLLGRVLYRAVVPPVIGDQLERLMFDSPDTRVNVSLHFAEGTAADLVHLPWEQLFVPAQAARIGVRDLTTLTRVLLANPAEYSPPTSGQLTVLLVEAPRQFGTSTLADGSTPPGTQEVSAKVHELLASRPEIKLEARPRISAELLFDLLSDDPFTVVHYVGYGRYRGNVDEVALDDGRGGVAWLGPDDFAALVDAPPTRLVVLQACTGPSDLVPGDMTMLARRLLVRGVDAVVASQFPLPDLAAAVKLVDPFYKELASGRSLQVAVQRVRRGLTVKPWAQPALFARHPGDLRLRASEPPDAGPLSWGWSPRG